MKFQAMGIIACLALLPACGQKKRKKDVLHAPDVLLVETPLSLAGPGPTTRDDEAFNRCITGTADPSVLARCKLPYLDIPNAARDEQVEHILGSTLISHDWQRDRLKAFLQKTRPEIISMLTCVKAVAISSDIRPSFYYSPSGAIYLDAGYFAATQEEAGTVSTVPDSRGQNFDQINLLFLTLDTYRPETADAARFQDLESLLAHELAHACDFKAGALKGRYLSDDLQEAPENAVYQLAQWLYFGDKSAKATLVNYTPEQIGKSFQEGPVVDIYGYGNQFEHLAMIVQNHLGFEFDRNNRVAMLVDNPTENQSIRSFPIYWGMTGKFCQPDLFEKGRELTRRAVPMPIDFKTTQADCASIIHPAGTPLFEVLGLPPPAP